MGVKTNEISSYDTFKLEMVCPVGNKSLNSNDVSWIHATNKLSKTKTTLLCMR